MALYFNIDYNKQIPEDKCKQAENEPKECKERRTEGHCGMLDWCKKTCGLCPGTDNCITCVNIGFAM